MDRFIVDSLYQKKEYSNSKQYITSILSAKKYSADQRNKLYISQYKNEYYLNRKNAITYLYEAKKNIIFSF